MENFQLNKNIKSQLNKKYIYNKDTEWKYFTNPSLNLPDYGWKIHISATYNNFQEILNLTTEYCLRNNLNFKYIYSKTLFTSMISDSYNRIQSGKFITIYFATTCSFKKHANILDNKLSRFNGPRVLGDFQVSKNGVVHYRYGGFKKSYYFNKNDGIYQHNVYTTKTQIFTDNRKAYPFLPSGIENPLKNKEEEKENTNSLLNDRYQPQIAIKFSNKGGVYRCLDTKNNEQVIIKECRPFIGSNKTKYDSQHWHHQEYVIHKQLYKHNLCPRPIDFFKQDDHSFSVYKEVKGSSLRSYISNPTIHLSYAKKKKIALKAIELYKKIANNGYYHKDFNPNNIFINDKNELILVDLEHVHSEKNHYKPGYTPGYCNPNNNNIEFSLGRVLYFIYCATDPLINNDSQCSTLIMKKILDANKVSNEHLKIIEKTLDCKKNNKFNLPDKQVIINDLEVYLSQLVTERRAVRTSSFGKTTHYLNSQHGISGIIRALDLKTVPSIKLKKILEQLETNYLTNKAPGLVFGQLGIIEQILRIKSELNEKLPKSYLNQIEFNYFSSESFEFFHGKAGIINFICDYQEHLPNRFVKKIIIHFQTYCLEKECLSKGGATTWQQNTIENSSFSNYQGFGFGHGDAGIMFALLKSIKIVPNTKIKELAHQTINNILKNSSETGKCLYTPHGPHDTSKWTHVCNGSSGIINLLIEMHQLDPKKYQEITLKYIYSIGHNFRSKSIGFCHGLAGDLYMIKKAHNIIKNNSVVKSLIQEMESFLIFRVRKLQDTVDNSGELISDDFGEGLAGVLVGLKKS